MPLWSCYAIVTILALPELSDMNDSAEWEYVGHIGLKPWGDFLPSRSPVVGPADENITLQIRKGPRLVNLVCLAETRKLCLGSPSLIVMGHLS